MSERRRLPSASESPSETAQSGTKVRSPNQATLRRPITRREQRPSPARRRSPGVGRAPCSSPAAAAPGTGGQAEHGERRDEHRDAGEQPAHAEPEPEDERRHDDRPERVAGVAADVEERHPARALAAADVDGELGSLGVKGGDADARDEDEHEERAVARGDGRETDADAASASPPAAARGRRGGPTRGRRAAARATTTRARPSIRTRRERVAEVELVREERKQRRHAARGEIGGAVAAGQHGHPLAVDRLAHGSSLGGGPVARG